MILPTKVIAVLPVVSPVASRFNLPMEAVTVSIHGLSPPTWSEGVGEASLSPGLVVGITHFSGLAAWGFMRSLGLPLSILVTDTITSFWGRTSVAPGGIVSADKVVDSARMVLCVPLSCYGLGFHTSNIISGRWVTASLGEVSVFWLLASGMASSRLWRTSCLLKVASPLAATLALPHSLPKGDKCPVLADLPSLPNTAELAHRPGSAAAVVARHPDR